MNYKSLIEEEQLIENMVEYEALSEEIVWEPIDDIDVATVHEVTLMVGMVPRGYNDTLHDHLFEEVVETYLNERFPNLEDFCIEWDVVFEDANVITCFNDKQQRIVHTHINLNDLFKEAMSL